MPEVRDLDEYRYFEYGVELKIFDDETECWTKTIRTFYICEAIDSPPTAARELLIEQIILYIKKTQGYLNWWPSHITNIRSAFYLFEFSIRNKDGGIESKDVRVNIIDARRVT